MLTESSMGFSEDSMTDQDVNLHENGTIIDQDVNLHKNDSIIDQDVDLHKNVAEKLSPEMVKLALKFVDQKHPLQKVSLFKVFPRLNYFGSYLNCLRNE
jgi:hypothetical protein